MIKAGTVCKVICDSSGFFQPGDIVVTLEYSNVPYVCLMKNYKGTFQECPSHRYGYKEYNPLVDSELEVLDDRAEE